MTQVSHCNYFAYGSNMSPERLQKRVPSAKFIGVFLLARYELKFHKTGKDGSAKADAFFTGKDSHSILGVLYSIDNREKKYLDEAEGLGYGYEEKEVKVQAESGEIAVGFLYYATNINSTLRPFSWYMHHILKGAENARLPRSYVYQISHIQTVEDTDKKRDTQERLIHSS